MRRRLRGWRPALRIARRDAWRHKGRSAVVLVMVALPVLAVVSLDTLARTAQVTPVEGLGRHLGSSDALVMWSGESNIHQDPTALNYSSEQPAPQPGGSADPQPVKEPALSSVLPTGSRLVPIKTGSVVVRTELGLSRPAAIEVNLSDPLTKGLYTLQSGRLPHAADEVVVSARLAARGFEAGSLLTLDNGTVRHVVGQIRWIDNAGAELVVGRPARLGLSGGEAIATWLVDAPRPVTWPEVKALNARGFVALSRAVVANPPPPSQVDDPGYNNGMSSSTIAVLAMIVAMALLEVVLLAGPAFAVGVRRQQRSLALLTATGGRPRDVRRVVLGGGIVLGGAASVIGVVGGVVGARLAVPAVQHFSTEQFGPFQVSARDIVAIAACGLLSAVLAALAPAFAAARQDVVAVLAGRRGQTRSPLWSPLLGALLLAAGVVGAVLGATRGAGGEMYITAAAISAVLGMVLIIPIIVAQLGRLARALPLTARFAVRDAARHRSRTAPAVAAVAATVAGVVALGIGGSSDGAQNRATYTPRGPIGAAVVTDQSDHAADWAAISTVVRQQVPGGRITPMRGVINGGDFASPPGGAAPRGLDVQPLFNGAKDPLGESFAESFGSSVLVGTKTFQAMGLQLSTADRNRATAALQAGHAVVFVRAVVASKVTGVQVVAQQFPTGDGNGDIKTLGKWSIPAIGITAPGTDQPAQAVLPESALKQTGFTATTTALMVRGTHISTSEGDALNEALTGVDQNAYAWVERGFHDNSTAVALLLLGCVGGALVLGGTLTATFLALSDARPDFATMGAVGAAPGTRRRVAASYAATIGLVGAVTGAVVGFIPGIAVTYPLTDSSWAVGSLDAAGAPIAGHYLDVPWLLVIGLVIGLPLLTAAVVGAATRSRLPMVSRLS
jgi:putative ABC transport system permease protein